jgi:hypothetical protein
VILLACIAFLLALLDEWVATARTLATAERRRKAAAGWCCLYVLVTGLWAYLTVTNLWTVGPSAAGAALGSWLGTASVENRSHL